MITSLAGRFTPCKGSTECVRDAWESLTNNVSSNLELERRFIDERRNFLNPYPDERVVVAIKSFIVPLRKPDSTLKFSQMP